MQQQQRVRQMLPVRVWRGVRPAIHHLLAVKVQRVMARMMVGYSRRGTLARHSIQSRTGLRLSSPHRSRTSGKRESAGPPKLMEARKMVIFTLTPWTAILGFVKIGYTTREFTERLAEWEFNCNRRTEIIFPGPSACGGVRVPDPPAMSRRSATKNWQIAESESTVLYCMQAIPHRMVPHVVARGHCGYTQAFRPGGKSRLTFSLKMSSGSGRGCNEQTGRDDG